MYHPIGKGPTRIVARNKYPSFSAAQQEMFKNVLGYLIRPRPRGAQTPEQAEPDCDTPSVVIGCPTGSGKSIFGQCLAVLLQCDWDNFQPLCMRRNRHQLSADPTNGMVLLIEMTSFTLQQVSQLMTGVWNLGVRKGPIHRIGSHASTCTSAEAREAAKKAVLAAAATNNAVLAPSLYVHAACRAECQRQRAGPGGCPLKTPESLAVVAHDALVLQPAGLEPAAPRLPDIEDFDRDRIR